MEGCKERTTDGRTPVERILAPSHDARRSGARRASAGAGEPTESLRARLVAATVELVAQASGPRLGKTRDTLKSRMDRAFSAPSPHPSR